MNLTVCASREKRRFRSPRRCSLAWEKRYAARRQRRVVRMALHMWLDVMPIVRHVTSWDID